MRGNKGACAYTGFEQTILRSLFSGFVFDEEARRIKPCPMAQNIDGLIRIGKERFGYDEGEALNLITKVDSSIFSALDFTSIRRVDSFRLSSLRKDYPPLPVLRILHNGPALTLLYLEGCQFCLLNDEFHALLPGDRLQCWTYTLSVGDEAIFRVIRDGKLYPDERHVLKVNRIEAIELLKPIFLPMPYNESAVPPVMAVDFVRVGEPRSTNEGYVFLPQDFTNHDKAMFFLDLKRLEFSLNPEFDQSLYSHPDRSYVDILCTVCNYTEEQEMEKRRKTIAKGKMEIVNINNNQYALLVTRKATITL